jgi:hypothetical protein
VTEPPLVYGSNAGGGPTAEGAYVGGGEKAGGGATEYGLVGATYGLGAAGAIYPGGGA